MRVGRPKVNMVLASPAWPTPALPFPCLSPHDTSAFESLPNSIGWIWWLAWYTCLKVFTSNRDVRHFGISTLFTLVAYRSWQIDAISVAWYNWAIVCWEMLAAFHSKGSWHFRDYVCRFFRTDVKLKSNYLIQGLWLGLLDIVQSFSVGCTASKDFNFLNNVYTFPGSGAGAALNCQEARASSRLRLLDCHYWAAIKTSGWDVASSWWRSDIDLKR